MDEANVNLIYELPISEFEGWKTAMGLSDDEANEKVETVLLEMIYPEETFAQASARLGIGNPDSPEVHNWYYNHRILYI